MVALRATDIVHMNENSSSKLVFPGSFSAYFHQSAGEKQSHDVDLFLRIWKYTSKSLHPTRPTIRNLKMMETYENGDGE